MRKALLLLVTLATISCVSQKDYDKIVTENASLKAALDSCKTEIENYKNTPEKLYTEALGHIKSKDLILLGEVMRKTYRYHPESKEYQDIKKAYEKLVAEKEKKQNAERNARRSIVEKLIRTHDDISGTTWYMNQYFTHYNNSNHISLYIGKKGANNPYLRLKMSYYGESWIFFKQAYLSYDGNTIEIPFDEFREKETENNTKVWEWIDVAVSPELLNFLKKAVDGKTIKMRLSGKYTKDHTLTQTEIKALKDVLLGYDVLANGI